MVILQGGKQHCLTLRVKKPKWVAAGTCWVLSNIFPQWCEADSKIRALRTVPRRWIIFFVNANNKYHDHVQINEKVHWTNIQLRKLINFNVVLQCSMGLLYIFEHCSITRSDGSKHCVWACKLKRWRWLTWNVDPWRWNVFRRCRWSWL